MKSDVIYIDSKGRGFREAIEQTSKTAAYNGLNESDSLDLQLLTEEVLSLVRSITGEIEAAFWLEAENRTYELHVATETVMDKEKRRELIQTSTSLRNEAATGFLGKLRDAFEEALTAEADQQETLMSEKELADLPQGILGNPDWDGYERSILQTVADQVEISIRGGKVEVVIRKTFVR